MDETKEATQAHEKQQISRLPATGTGITIVKKFSKLLVSLSILLSIFYSVLLMAKNLYHNSTSGNLLNPNNNNNTYSTTTTTTSNTIPSLSEIMVALQRLEAELAPFLVAPAI